MSKSAIKPVTYGSVCSGIEAASIAWEPLGWRASWFAEIETFPSQVLAHRWPDVPNLGDMTKIAEDVRLGFVDAPDVLVGGTPCQAFSMAGRRLGLSDARGQLTLAYVDLVDAIDESRLSDGKPPCIAVWENVPGVLSSNDNAFGCFLAALAGDDEPLEPGPRPEPGRSSSHWTWDKKTGEHRPKWSDAGYVVGPTRTIAWVVKDAQYFGLAQRRRRVFVVASARAGFDPSEVLFEFDGVRRDSAPSREAREEVAGTLDARADGGGFPGTDGACANHVAPADRGSVGVEVCPTWWDGGQVCQTLDAVLAKGQAMPEKNRFPAVLQPVPINPNALRDGEAKTPSPDANGNMRLRNPSMGVGKPGDPADTVTAGAPGMVAQPIPILEAGARTGKSTTDPRAGIGIGKPGDPMYTLQAGKQHAVCVTGEITHTLKADGFDGFDGSEDGTGRGQPIVASYAFQPRIARNGRGDMGDVVSALTAQAGETGKGDAAPCVAIAFQSSQSGVRIGETHATLDANNGSRRHNGVITEMAVRRLMPVECERLQGFPDGHTDTPGARGKSAADGPRYKALGNSMATNCMKWIGLRLARALALHDEDLLG